LTYFFSDFRIDKRTCDDMNVMQTLKNWLKEWHSRPQNSEFSQCPSSSHSKTSLKSHGQREAERMMTHFQQHIELREPILSLDPIARLVLLGCPSGGAFAACCTNGDSPRSGAATLKSGQYPHWAVCDDVNTSGNKHTTKYTWSRKPFPGE